MLRLPVYNKWIVERNKTDNVIIHPGGGHRSIMLKTYTRFGLERNRIYFEKLPEKKYQLFPIKRTTFEFSSSEQAEKMFKQVGNVQFRLTDYEESVYELRSNL